MQLDGGKSISTPAQLILINIYIYATLFRFNDSFYCESILHVRAGVNKMKEYIFIFYLRL